MNKLVLILAISLASAGAYAQGTSGDVTMSTDPAKAAEVERHAQDLQARQSSEAHSKSTAAHKGTAHAGTTHHTKGKTSGTHKSSSHHQATAPKS